MLGELELFGFLARSPKPAPNPTETTNTRVAAIKIPSFLRGKRRAVEFEDNAGDGTSFPTSLTTCGKVRSHKTLIPLPGAT